ncbi:MAG: hypothetical protein KDI37_10570, partial [Xanthomonadales bacterium]|nr:hypothetical protein [Xanthomonadales bacterium]
MRRSRSDMGIVEDFCESKGYGLVAELGLEWLVGSWEHWAMAVSTGQIGTVRAEHINMLDGRQILHEIMDAMPEEVSESLRVRICAADAIFLESTIPLANSRA